jgi:uncharacterized protein (DUF433 family)
MAVWSVLNLLFLSKQITQMETPRIRIIQSDIAPLISESRASVYDVMESLDCGYNIYQISEIYNLSPFQVETAIEYIKKHRQRLEPKLKKILKKAAERERYYRALEQEIRKQKPDTPMTPRRKALYALL